MPTITTVAELGLAIAHARKARKFSQAEVAQIVGIRQGTVSEIERGKDTAHIGNALRLAQAVGLELYVSASTENRLEPMPQRDVSVVIDEPFPDDSINLDDIVAPRRRPR